MFIRSGPQTALQGRTHHHLTDELVLPIGGDGFAAESERRVPSSCAALTACFSDSREITVSTADVRGRPVSGTAIKASIPGTG